MLSVSYFSMWPINLTSVVYLQKCLTNVFVHNKIYKFTLTQQWRYVHAHPIQTHPNIHAFVQSMCMCVNVCVLIYRSVCVSDMHNKYWHFTYLLKSLFNLQRQSGEINCEVATDTYPEVVMSHHLTSHTCNKLYCT